MLTPYDCRLVGLPGTFHDSYLSNSVYDQLVSHLKRQGIPGLTEDLKGRKYTYLPHHAPLTMASAASHVAVRVPKVQRSIDFVVLGGRKFRRLDRSPADSSAVILKKGRDFAPHRCPAVIASLFAVEMVFSGTRSWQYFAEVRYRKVFTDLPAPWQNECAFPPFFCRADS